MELHCSKPDSFSLFWCSKNMYKNFMEPLQTSPMCTVFTVFSVISVQEIDAGTYWSCCMRDAAQMQHGCSEQQRVECLMLHSCKRVKLIGRSQHMCWPKDTRLCWATGINIWKVEWHLEQRLANEKLHENWIEKAERTVTNYAHAHLISCWTPCSVCIKWTAI